MPSIGRALLASSCLFAAMLAAEPSLAQYTSSYYGGYNSPAMQQIRRDMITNAIRRQTGQAPAATNRRTLRTQPTNPQATNPE